MDPIERCAAEIVDLHDFLADWLNGRVDGTDAGFARIEQALHPDFTIIGPSGGVLDREAVVAQLRGAHGIGDGAAPLRIDIRNTRVRTSCTDGAVVTYEEWQFTGDEPKNRRISTVFFDFAAGAPNGVRWRHLHETWMPAD